MKNIILLILTGIMLITQTGCVTAVSAFMYGRHAAKQSQAYQERKIKNVDRQADIIPEGYDM